MARPRTIDDERILEAAREVFLERGVGATTAEVAARAGISEGTVFKRFATKRDLFRAAVRPPGPPGFLETLRSRRGDADVAGTLRAAGLEAITFFRQVVPLLMMAWSSPGPDGMPDVLGGPRSPPVLALDEVRRYFVAQRRAGRIAGCDPAVLALVYLGSLERYVFFEMLDKAGGEVVLPAERAFVDKLLRIILPDA